MAAIAETLGRPGASTSAPPILVAGDSYVIDGHHRLAAVQRIDPDGQIPIVQIEATLPDVLRHARDYLASPAAKSATGPGSDQKRLAELIGIA